MPVRRPRHLARLTIAAIVAICASALLASSALAAPNDSARKRKGKRPPVKSLEIGAFGDVLTTKRNKALLLLDAREAAEGHDPLHR